MNNKDLLAPSASADTQEKQLDPSNELKAPEALTTRKQLRKILREDSNWSIRSIFITALTGVSAAIIATQLTGLVSSLVLVALMSFVSASISELYRISLALTGLGAKRAAAITGKRIPSLTIASSEKETESKQLMSGAINVVNDAYKLNEEQKAQQVGPLKRGIYHLKNYGKANPFLWLVGIFLLTSVTSISVTYLITDGNPPQIIQRTVIQTEQLSNDDKTAIVTEAKDQALDQLESTDSNRTVIQVPAEDQIGSEQLEAISSRLAALEAELAASKDQAPNATQQPSPPVSNDQATISSLQTKLAALQAETDALNKRIIELEAAAKSNGSSPAPAGNSVGNTPQPSITAP